MSFVDNVKYVRQLSVVDEFGGLGEAAKVSRFYVTFRATDDDGQDIRVSEADVVAAIREKDIVIAGWAGLNNYSLAADAANPDGCPFIFSGCRYRDSLNILAISFAGDYREDAGLSVRFMDGDTEITSSCYLSPFPSAVFINRHPAAQ
ncbi:hypothetical protein [Pantoea sp. AS142]|uniref:hypothetical protein n=1 Tax=Pantoea sp. AS142 TaxID=3081292 RepID=UPI0030190161